MKYIPGFFLLLLLFPGCSGGDKPYLFPYTWADSVINYQLTNDSLVLMFPHPPACKRWHFSIYIHDDTIPHQLPNGDQIFYTIKNNRIAVPVGFPRAVLPDTVKIALFGGPDDGHHFIKTSTGYIHDLGSNRYYKHGNLLRLRQKKTFPDFYIIPDSLLTGDDSVYYQKKFARFMKDSVEVVGFDMPSGKR